MILCFKRSEEDKLHNRCSVIRATNAVPARVAAEVFLVTPASPSELQSTFDVVDVEPGDETSSASEPLTPENWL